MRLRISAALHIVLLFPLIFALFSTTVFGAVLPEDGVSLEESLAHSTLPETSSGMSVKVQSTQLDTGKAQNLAPAALPYNGQQDVSTTVTIMVSLNDASVTDVSSLSFSLKNDQADVSGVVMRLTRNRSLWFAPYFPLAQGTTYTANVSGPVLSATNETLHIDHTWTFTTTYSGNQTSTVASRSQADIDKPVSSSEESVEIPFTPNVTPRDGERDIDPGTVISVSFDNSNFTDVSSLVLTLNDGQTEVSGTTAYDGVELSFFPSVLLKRGVTYGAQVSGTLESVAGNSHSVDYTWAFKTVDAAGRDTVNDDSIVVASGQIGVEQPVAKSDDGSATLVTPHVIPLDSEKNVSSSAALPSPTAAASVASNEISGDTGAIDWAKSIASASGNIYTVSSDAEFNYIASIVGPGDVVLIEDGTYAWAPLYIDSNGTPEAPIIYTAKNPGKVVLLGGQRLFRITGRHNIIGGFVFKGIRKRVFHFTGVAGPGTTGASDNRITDNVIIESGATTIGSMCPCWMFEFERRSHRNRVDHNLFARNYGFIRIHLDSEDAVENGPSQDNIIDRNVFRDALGPHVPVLQIGQGEPSQAGSSRLQVRTVFEHNLIQNHNTTTGEIVSVKSSNNIVRFNTFENSHGGINLRHGNQSEVYGNYFKGGDSDAIAIHGAYHRVYENVVNVPNR